MFKVGQKIKCIAAGSAFNSLTNGRIYTVLVCGDEFVTVMDDRNNMGGYDLNRFEPITSEAPEITKQYVIDTIFSAYKDAVQNECFIVADAMAVLLKKNGFNVKVTLEYSLVEV